MKQNKRKAKVIDKSGKINLLKLANMKISGGPKDLSQKLDHYLYGK